MNKKELYNKILQLDGLTNEEKSELLGLLRKQKKYGLVWEDKPEDVEERLREELPVLVEDISKAIISTEADAPNHILIEGDNLEVLKLLQEKYLGKIKMIYIDPPYNTGNDFIYKDNFAQNAQEYVANSGQTDEEGNRLVKNVESNGRFHSDWLSMMYPRLKIARNLLADDGLIFISCGDEEIDNLKKICNEVFGADNFRNQIAVRRGAKSVQAQFDTWDSLGKDYEFLLLFSKIVSYRFPQQNKKLDEVKPGSWNGHWRGTDRPTMRYELFGITPQTGQWRWSQDRSLVAIKNYERLLRELNVEKPNDSQINEWLSYQKDDLDLLRLSENGKPEHYIASTDTTLLNSSWMDLLVGSSSEIQNLFKQKVFDTAKLTALLKRCIKFCPNNDSIVLDFFSGSATTAHAVMQLNAEDGGNRKFIMVQLPEVCDEKSEAYKAGYNTICDIGKERIRRAGAKIKEELEKTNPERAKTLDTGFRVLRLDSSNMKDVFYRPVDLNRDKLMDFTENVKEDRNEMDLLFQIMPELNADYTSKIEETYEDGKTIFNVESNYIVACFAEDISEKVIRKVASYKPDYAVFRDSCFPKDSDLANVEQIFRAESPETRLRIL